MTVDTATYVGDLDTAVPANTDPKSEGGANFRQVKTALVNSFPNISGAVTATHTQINAAAASGGLYSTGTSTTSMTVGTGTQTFTTQASKGFAIGQYVRITSDADVANYMLGTVTAYNSTTGAMSVSVSTVGGSGTVAAWSITVSTLPSGVAAGPIDLLTGANIASASTINLDSASGNRIHLTGTTTVTAVTLTRGPRTVIHDGILTLTHHATTCNLPGAANIVTAAGDRSIWESDGTTVYCVAYIRAVGEHCVSVHTGNGHGSGSTCIRRFTTTLTNTGAAITYADSASLGATFTINQPGYYEVFYIDALSSGLAYHGISVNSAELTTAVVSITAATRFGITSSPAAGTGGAVTRVLKLAAGDVVRPHTAGTQDNTNAALSAFSIRRIG